ncbi:MAG TPA: topoisomerase DNA-binding C4 zinc finger domain-containing protein [Microvirga sp.]|jgi:DNA-binding helix-hairpin-helix protein with protein kinase domain|nr:topoisomerase DNA-binding C4 zinc finger domain-containing protein [Microvirga sp.]
MLGRGGEGEVFNLEGREDIAAKIYYPAHRANREPKIRTMISEHLALRSNLVSFPQHLLLSKSGEFLGFSMRLVQSHKPVFELYAPAARKANFPKANYPFLVRAATNISRAVAAVHKSGCIVGDVNQSGILVSEKATAALIDADSFQFSAGGKIFPCNVGVPLYTSPELQGKNLSSIVRTENHDAFGLSVVIFLLLGMGKHPYAGTYAKGDLRIEEAISQNRFAYSKIRRSDLLVPPGAISLEDFPNYIRQAFEEAFGVGGIRPSADQWVSVLSELEKSLTRCSRNPLHWYPAAASKCTWCRVESEVGITLFVPEAGATPSYSIEGKDLDRLFSDLTAVVLPDLSIMPPLPQLLPPVSERAKRAKHPEVGFWGSLLPFLAPKPTNLVPELLQQLSRVDTNLNSAIVRWRQNSGLVALYEIRRDLLATPRFNAQSELAGVIGKKAIIATEEAKRNFLQRYFIRNTKINGVGPSKLATLSSYGFETAADLVSKSVSTVPGFGPVNSRSLVAWARSLEAKYVPTVDPALTQRIRSEAEAEVAQKQKAYTEGFRKRCSEFQSALSMFNRQISAIDPAIASAWRDRQQVVADLNYFGVTAPGFVAPINSNQNPSAGSGLGSRPNVGPGQTNAGSTVNPYQTSSTASPSCPVCSSKMVTRQARRGRLRGNRFWGCTRYPVCTGTRPI